MNKKNNNIETAQSNIFNNDISVNNFNKVNSFSNRILTLKEKSLSNFYKMDENSGRGLTKNTIPDVVFPSNFSFHK